MKKFILLLSLSITLLTSIQAQSVSENIEQGNYANINSLNMYYEIHGSGTPLLYLHGGGLCTEAHKNEIIFLSQSYKVIAADRQGQGRTADIDREISYEGMAIGQLELLKHLKIDSCIVYGNSDGGPVALYMAIKSPKTVTKLIVEGTNYHYSGIEDDWTELLKSVTPEMYQNDFFNALSPNGSEYWPTMLSKLKNMWLNSPTITPLELNEITCPTLIIVGDRDMIKIEHTVSLYKAMPNASLFIVPSTSHEAMVEKPDFVRPVVLDFINAKNQ
jgi:pimeloyl-ACP methyl ester carboxylesterase